MVICFFVDALLAEAFGVGLLTEFFAAGSLEAAGELFGMTFVVTFVDGLALGLGVISTVTDLQLTTGLLLALFALAVVHTSITFVSTLVALGVGVGVGIGVGVGVTVALGVGDGVGVGVGVGFDVAV